MINQYETTQGMPDSELSRDPKKQSTIQLPDTGFQLVGEQNMTSSKMCTAVVKT